MGVQDYTENLKFLYEYLSETNYELAEKLSRFIRDGIGKPEILLESAVYASFNKAYCNSALLLLEAYEAYLLEAGSDLYPFIIYAVREEILNITKSILKKGNIILPLKRTKPHKKILMYEIRTLEILLYQTEV